MLILPHRAFRPPPGLLAREVLRCERGLYMPGREARPRLRRATITTTDLSTNGSTTGGTVTITGVTAAAGTLMLVAVHEASTAGGGIGSVSDGSNTYTATKTGRPNNSTSDGIGTIFWSVLGTALSSGTITYTKGTSGAATEIAAFYATSTTGWPASPLDLNPTPTTGSSAAPSISGYGTAAVAGELFVAFTAFFSISSTYTQDSTHTWVTPFDNSSDGHANTGGGNQVNAGTSAITYSPTITSAPWAAFIVTFQPNIPNAFTSQQGCFVMP